MKIQTVGLLALAALGCALPAKPVSKTAVEQKPAPTTSVVKESVSSTATETGPTPTTTIPLPVTTIVTLCALGKKPAHATPIGRADDQGYKVHGNVLEARDVLHTVTTVVTSTLVQTEPAAIIWVDQSGQIITTTYLASPSPSIPTTLNPVPTAFSFVTQASPTAPTTLEASDVASFWPSQSAYDEDVDNEASPTSAAVSGYGIAYDMIGTGPCKDASTIDSDMALLASKGYTVVRTYDIGCDIGMLVKSAMNHGMKAFVGINGVSSAVADVGTLINWINKAEAWNGVDTVNIGNEVVSNGGTAAAVVAAIAAAKPLLQAAGFTGNIVTVDTYDQHLAYPSLCSASSYCAVNAQPFFNDNCNSSGAGDYVMNILNTVSTTLGKDTVITESGWPYAGSSNGDAIASPSDQTTAINSIKAAFGDMPDKVYLFQGFDAKYKPPGPLGVEQHFGIYGH